MMSQLCSFVKEIAALSLLILLPLSLSCQSDVMIADKSETRVVVDSFVQVDMIDELDILVVVDTSGSMRDNFDDVGLGMETLRIDIENLTLDYQFGFITADPTNSSFVGPYSSTSSSIDILLAASLLNNTFYEEGFAATYEFLRSEAGLSFSRHPIATGLISPVLLYLPVYVFQDSHIDQFGPSSHPIHFGNFRQSKEELI